MGIISTNRGDFIFRSADDAIKFVQAAPQEESDIWISGEQPYPCLSVCINGKYAAVHFFQNDEGDMWLSYNDKNQKGSYFYCRRGRMETRCQCDYFFNRSVFLY